MKLRVICKGPVDEKIGRLYPFMVRVEEYGKPRDYHFKTWEGVVEWVRVRDENTRYNRAFEAISAVGFMLRRTPGGWDSVQIARCEDDGPAEWFEVRTVEEAVELARLMREAIDKTEVSAEVERAFDAMRKKGGPLTPVFDFCPGMGPVVDWTRPSTYVFN